jgi:hypothetical protein
MTLNASRAVLGSLAALAIAACSSGSQGVASKYVATGNIGPAGGTIPVTASDDSTLAGTTIVIPPNALTTTRTISIGLSTEAVVTGSMKEAGPVVDFEPTGLVFAVPATVTIPVTVASGTAASSVYIEAVEENGSEQQISVQSLAHGLATFQVKGFTRFGAWTRGSPTACATNADCATGEVCVDNACASPVDAGRDATTCAAGQTECSSRCVDLSSDPANCGACGMACATGATCGAGVCATTTPTGCTKNSDCPAGEECVDNACASPVDAGRDAATCAAGEVDCSGTCVDVSTDSANCGGCGMRCGAPATCVSGACTLPPGCTTNADCAAGEVCVGNVCTAPVDAGTDAMVCAGGMTLCTDVCVDLQSDPSSCGSCGTACDVRSTCVAGACTPATGCSTGADCAAGEVCVGNVCVAGTDAGSDAALGCSTSAECAVGQECVGYVCVAASSDAGSDAADAGTCPANENLCAGACVNLATDPDNCGACGMTCATGESCVRAVCTA